MVAQYYAYRRDHYADLTTTDALGLVAAHEARVQADFEGEAVHGWISRGRRR